MKVSKRHVGYLVRHRAAGQLVHHDAFIPGVAPAAQGGGVGGVGGWGHHGIGVRVDAEGQDTSASLRRISAALEITNSRAELIGIVGFLGAEALCI